MNRVYLKTIIGGILLGTALYFVPFFLLKVMIFFLVFGTIAWFFRGRRRHHYAYRWAMADRIRSMSDEEYEHFKSERVKCADRMSNQKTED